MGTFTEAPYVLALKETYLTSRCSLCFKTCSNSCSICKNVVYCNEQCRIKDEAFHKIECEMYRNASEDDDEYMIVRMILRVIIRLNIDGGEPEHDLCTNLPTSIVRRSWSDLLGHRDEIPYSERHWKEWVKTRKQIDHLFGNRFNHIDLLEIFGKILINRFRVGIFENLFEGRIAVGWAIYLTTSRFNHSCQPDLLQCSYDIIMRLKFANELRTIPDNTFEFNQLTVSYRHQNDFRLTDSSTYVPTRKQRRHFVSFFFFNCHCPFCNDDLRNRYWESLTNRICQICGDFLVLQNSYQQSNTSILTCLGRKTCSNTEIIVDHLTISFIHQINSQTIEDSEQKLNQIEQFLHPQSILLLQQREKLFFAYQILLKQSDFNQQQRLIVIRRTIQLGELLLQGYDIYLKQSSMYPKIFLTDLANLYENIGEHNRAKQIYRKAYDLWQSDYQNHIDYQQFIQKL